MNTINIRTHGWDGATLTQREKCNEAGLRLSRILGVPVKWRMTKNTFEIRWKVRAVREFAYEHFVDCEVVEEEKFAVWDCSAVWSTNTLVPCTYGLPFAIPRHIFDTFPGKREKCKGGFNPHPLHFFSYQLSKE